MAHCTISEESKKIKKKRTHAAAAANITVFAWPAIACMDVNVAASVTTLIA